MSPPGASSGVTPAFLFNVLRQWGKIVIPVGILLGAVAATLVYVTFTPMYQAKFLIWIDDQNPFLVKPVATDGNFVNNQIGLIRNSLVLAPVVSRPEVANLPELRSAVEPVELLRQQVGVVPAWGSEHYYITCTNRDPHTAAIIANAVADQYFDMVAEFQAGRTSSLIKLLDDERAATERESQVLRENLRQMTIDQTGRDPYAARTGQDGAPNSPLYILQSQLTDNQVEQLMLRSQVRAMEDFIEKHPAEVTDVMVERMLEQNELLQQHHALIADKKGRLEAIKAASVQGEKATAHVRLQEEIKVHEEALAGLQKQLRERARTELTTQLTREQQGKVAELRSRLLDLETRHAALKLAYEEELKKAKQYTGETFALEVKRAEYARSQGVLQGLTDRSFALRTEQRAPRRVDPVERAKVPLSPIESVPVKKMGLAGGGMFLLPYLLAVFWEMWNRRIGSAEQLEQQTKLAVVGEIASLPVRTGAGRFFRPERAYNRGHLFEESVESLRTCLILTRSLRGSQVLTVASAATQEGKTTVATQLAISLAKSSQGATLLVDADVRAPDVHRIFDIDNVGLVEVLSGKCTLEDAVVATGDGDLRVLPAGKLEGSPHQVLTREAVQAFLDEARKKYRHVVIDTAPVLVAGESVVLAVASDATLMCTRRDVSREEQVRKACRRLEGAGAHVVGGVFSGIPLRRYAYRYGYGSYYSRQGRYRYDYGYRREQEGG